MATPGKSQKRSLESPSSGSQKMMRTDPVQIQTFIFMDLETTDLRESKNGTRQRVGITEIAMVALHRSAFQEPPSTRGSHHIPRVLGKLVIAVRPTRKIHDEAKQKSGLSEENLANERIFDNLLADQIISFITRYQGTVCMVAHGGHTLLDFPALRTELVAVDRDLPGGDVRYLDSWELFQNYPPIRNAVPHNREGSPVTSLGNSYQVIFREPLPDSHTAEGDALGLAKIFCARRALCDMADEEATTLEQRNIEIDLLY